MHGWCRVTSLYYTTYPQYNIRAGTRLAVRGVRGGHMISSYGEHLSSTCSRLIQETDPGAAIIRVAEDLGMCMCLYSQLLGPAAPGDHDKQQ